MNYYVQDGKRFGLILYRGNDYNYTVTIVILEIKGQIFEYLISTMRTIRDQFDFFSPKFIHDSEKEETWQMQVITSCSLNDFCDL